MAHHFQTDDQVSEPLREIAVEPAGSELDAVERLRLELAHRTASEQRYAELYRRERAGRIAAEEAGRAKDQFLAMVAHDLRTPLSGIVGWAQLARADAAEGSPTEHALSRIEANAEAQAQLIRDLLDVTRMASGKLSMQMAPVDLATIAVAAVATVRPAAEAKRIRMLVYTGDTGDTAASARGDALRLQQVAWNLMSNAIKFTPEGGTVCVVVEQLDGHAVLRVIDDGRGISPAFLPRLFQAFHQEIGDGHRGLGLGLSIVKQIVEAHGGSVRAESEGPGRGAAFTVALPLRTA